MNVMILVFVFLAVACVDNKNDRGSAFPSASSSGFYIATPFGTRPLIQQELAGTDDHIIIEGDIAVWRKDLISEAQYKAQRGFHALNRLSIDTQWNGIVPYVIINPPDANVVNQAIANWGARTTMTFIPRTTQRQYLKFVAQTQGGGSSYVGKMPFSDGQEVWIGPGCPLSCVEHEIGHALGLWHEHNRPDRDAHINVFMQNIIESSKSQYTKVTTGMLNYAYGPYDVTSIMHYASRSGGCLGGPCLTTKSGAEIPYNKPISAGDIHAVNRLNLVTGQLAAIDAEYNRIFTRTTTAAEKFHWLQSFDIGQNLGTVIEHIITHPVTTNRMTSDYQSIMERAVTVAELEVGRNYLRAGNSILDFRSHIANGAESRKKLTARFALTLGREPNANELDALVRYVGTGNHLSAVPTSLVFRTHRQEANDLIVLEFARILNRTPTTTEISRDRQTLANTGAAQLRQNLINTTETERLITKQIADVLGQTSSPQQITAARAALAAGTSLMEFRAGLASSDTAIANYQATQMRYFGHSLNEVQLDEVIKVIGAGTSSFETWRQSLLQSLRFKKQLAVISRRTRLMDMSDETFKNWVAMIEAPGGSVEKLRQSLLTK